MCSRRAGIRSFAERGLGPLDRVVRARTARTARRVHGGERDLAVEERLAARPREPSPPASSRAAVPRSAALSARSARSASSSSITPASAAATNSPTLWPIIAAGSDPPRPPQLGERVLDDEQRRLRPARVAAASPPPSSGCAAPGTAPCAGRRRASASERARSRSTAPRTTASLRYRPSAMPGYCAPWPGKHEDDRRRRGRLARSRIHRRADAATAPSDRLRRRPRADGGTRGDPTWSVKATSARSSSGWRSRWSASRVVAVSSASSLRAERTMSLVRTPLLRLRQLPRASSTTRCAFVPPTPNELTPARRGDAVSLPRLERRRHVERAAGEVDRRVRRLVVHGRRDRRRARARAPS